MGRPTDAATTADKLIERLTEELSNRVCGGCPTCNYDREHADWQARELLNEAAAFVAVSPVAATGLDCTCRSITCLTCLQREVVRLRDIEQRRLRSFAIRRPYCSPERTVIVAYSAEEAVDLAHKAYGYASNTTARDSEVDRG